MVLNLRTSLRWVLTGLLLLGLYAGLRAQDVPPRPNPPRLVNDLAGMLSAGERETLEQKLRGYADSTSTQVTVVIVKTTGQYPPGDYAFQIGRAWGVGQRDKDNGLVLLWASEDRKIYIATGYGLEGAIPDAVAKRIISEQITPAFREQRWFDGLNAATDEIIRRASGEYQAEPEGEVNETAGILCLVLGGLGVLLFLIWINRNRRGGGGRDLGGTGGGMFFPPYVTMGGWGSSSGSGRWGGSGGGSGGGFDFGGFGGGSFGGGGAGGDY